MSDQHLRVELQLLSPTCIAQRPTAPGALAQTLGYLSGTALRGGLATRWLAGRRYHELSAADQRVFGDVFLSGAVRFGNAVPFDSAAVTEVIPRTAWTTKRNGGWRAAGGTGVRDVLPTLLQLQTSEDRAGAWSLDNRVATLDDLEPLDQEFALRRGERWRGYSPTRRLISRTAVVVARGDDDRGLAAEGQLYSFEALETRERFTATIAGDSLLINQIAALLADNTDTGPVLRVGQGRSRGMGQVLVTRSHLVTLEEPGAAQLAEQAERFSARAGAPDDTLYLPVTLESDVILRDRYLLPCSSAAPDETLGRYLTDLPEPPGMRLLAAVQSTRWIGGWDALRDLPRPALLAVTMGSVWVFVVDRPVLTAALAWWSAAERRGLGERRAEGYGRVCLLHPLHREERDLW